MSQNPRYQLNPIEQTYLNACVDVRERTRVEKEQQQQRELESAKKQAMTERRVRRVTMGILIIAVILIGVLSYDPIRREVLKQQAMGPDLIEYSKSDVKLGDSRWNDNPDEVFYFYPEQFYPLSGFAIEPEMVTNYRYLKCVKADKCSLPSADPATYQDGNIENPVVNITALQASQFCTWLGRRLPTDKEWERATPSTELYEWTSTSYDYDWHQPESVIEWVDISTSPPDRLTLKGGGNQPDQITFRNEQRAFLSDGTTGFRCAISQ